MSNPLFEKPVFGEEVEYNSMVVARPDAPEWMHPDLGPKARPLEVGEMTRMLQKYWPEDHPRLQGFQSGGVWLGNGARMYEDIGGHPECSAQEVSSLEEVPAVSISGERRLYAVLANARGGDKVLERFMLMKQTNDHFGVTAGYHENYLADRRRLNIKAGQLGGLGLHLASRTIYAGAGSILLRQDSGGADYMLAQKMPDVHKDFDAYTTGVCKAVVNLRDEPEADEKRFVRVHVTSGDPHISPAALKLQRGTTQLVLLATQMGYWDPGLSAREGTLRNAAVGIAGDLTLRKSTIEQESGRRLSAWDAQVELFGLVQDMLDHEDSGGSLTEYAAVMRDWEHVLIMMERQEEDERLLALCGWLHRLRWLEGQMGWERDSVSAAELAQPKAIVQHIRYSQIGPNSVSDHLRTTEWADDMPSEETISYFERNGSPHMRSGTRGKFVQQFTGVADARVGWKHLILPDERGVVMNDPRQNYDRESQQLAARFRKRQTDRYIA